MNYELMPMDRSHLPQVAAIERESFSQPWSERLFADELFNDTVSLIVAEGEDGTVLGYAELQVILDEGCLEKIAVDKKFRRQHVAEELLGAFLRCGQPGFPHLRGEGVQRSGHRPVPEAGLPGSGPEKEILPGPYRRRGPDDSGV